MDCHLKVKHDYYCVIVVKCFCVYLKFCACNGKRIRKTCLCNEYPLEPHFYIAKLGYGGVYLFFLFLLQNIDCGYSLGGSNEYPQSMF